MSARQTLIHYSAGCHTCGKSCGQRNAQAWATNHVNANPGHFAEVTLGYAVSDEAPNTKDQDHA